MLAMEVAPLEAVYPGMTHRNSISGIIGFGGWAKGMLAVHAPEPVAKAITGGFLGIPVKEVNEDVKDAIGELANMLAGSVKLSLSEQSNEISLSIPSVICGDSYTINAPVNGDALLIPFVLQEGRFYVEFHFETGA
jgi:chemotaxis protein CheX